MSTSKGDAFTWTIDCFSRLVDECIFEEYSCADTGTISLMLYPNGAEKHFTGWTLLKVLFSAHEASLKREIFYRVAVIDGSGKKQYVQEGKLISADHKFLQSTQIIFYRAHLLSAQSELLSEEDTLTIYLEIFSSREALLEAANDELPGSVQVFQTIKSLLIERADLQAKVETLESSLKFEQDKNAQQTIEYTETLAQQKVQFDEQINTLQVALEVEKAQAIIRVEQFTSLLAKHKADLYESVTSLAEELEIQKEQTAEEIETIRCMAYESLEQLQESLEVAKITAQEQADAMQEAFEEEKTQLLEQMADEKAKDVELINALKQRLAQERLIATEAVKRIVQLALGPTHYNQQQNIQAIKTEKIKFVRHLESLLNSGELADFLCNVKGEQQFKVHKAILSSRSDVFRTMFEAGLRESLEGTVDIADIDPAVFQMFLRYCYTGEIPPLEALAEELFMAAHVYEVDELRTACEKHFQSILSVENVTYYYDFAELYSLDDLKRKCFDYMVANAARLMESESWENFVSSPNRQQFLINLTAALARRR